MVIFVLFVPLLVPLFMSFRYTNCKCSRNILTSHAIYFPSFKMLLFPFKESQKVKSIPLQAWSGPEDSRKLKFPDFNGTDCGKVISLTHRPPFLLEAESTPGP